MGMNALVIATAVVAAAANPVRLLQPANTVKEGVYTKEQAERGKPMYEKKCAECHGSMTTVSPAMAPLLNDYSFQLAWKDRSVGEFFERIRETMPQNEPGSLSPQETSDIVAYILSANQVRPGNQALSADVEALKQIRLDAVP
jgi:S-disulfanyl-L-cysteine oxidoreductase SoxD